MSMGEANSAEERYERLGLREALSRDGDYAGACYELARTLRLAYAPLPKAFKSLLLDDALFALRILPGVQTGNAISSANILVQAAEAVLPKQKKALVVSEFKHSVVAHLRRAKAHRDGDSVQLPYDLLVHIFRFLDLRSLVAASLVCWAWNSAANDKNLWRMLYSLFFGENNIKTCESKEEASQSIQHNRTTQVNPASSFNWKRAFRRKYTGNSSFKFTPIRAFCARCGALFWFSNLTCATSHDCHKLVPPNYEALKIRPISTSRVVEYLLGGAAKLTSSASDGSSSSDSDYSDSEESLPSSAQRLHKLWAYPKLGRT